MHIAIAAVNTEHTACAHAKSMDHDVKSELLKSEYFPNKFFVCKMHLTPVVKGSVSVEVLLGRRSVATLLAVTFTNPVTLRSSQ